MKSILSVLALAFALSTTGGFAHPGKTDERGGHVDSKTGKYHLHAKPEDKKKAAPAKKAPAKKAEPAKKK